MKLRPGMLRKPIWNSTSYPSPVYLLLRPPSTSPFVPREWLVLIGDAVGYMNEEFLLEGCREVT